MSAETPAETFKRGEKAGQIDQLLNQHGEHLKHINGSVAAGVVGLSDVKTELVAVRTDLAAVRTELGAVVQQMEADTVARLALADALEKADVVRRQQDVDKAEALRAKDDRTWLPVAKASGLVALAGSVVYLVVNLWPG